MAEQARRMEARMTEQPDRCPTCGSTQSHLQIYLGLVYQHGESAPGHFIPCDDPFHRPPRKEPDDEL